jgi:hypothetical protein
MPRLQDILFVLWGVALAVLLAFQLKIAVFALTLSPDALRAPASSRRL